MICPLFKGFLFIYMGRHFTRDSDTFGWYCIQFRIIPFHFPSLPPFPSPTSRNTFPFRIPLADDGRCGTNHRSFQLAQVRREVDISVNYSGPCHVMSIQGYTSAEQASPFHALLSKKSAEQSWNNSPCNIHQGSEINTFFFSSFSPFGNDSEPKQPE